MENLALLWQKVNIEPPEHHRQPSSKEVMDVQELGAYLGLGKSKIYSLIRQKKIPASRIGRQYRFSKPVIDAWLKERLITRGDEPQISLFSRTEPQHPRSDPAGGAVSEPAPGSKGGSV